MKRLLLLGGSGQVGREILKLPVPGTAVEAPASSELDMRDVTALQHAVRAIRPNVIINCAAFTRVDDAETESAAAFATNAEAPGAIAAAAHDVGARLVHVSTDYVFDGSGLPPYLPGSKVSPLSVYGASKRKGESAVLSANRDATVVRTAWVHSGSGVNFIATAVRLLQEGSVMRVVDDQVSTPTRAAHLAAALWATAGRTDVSGILHFTDAGVASWYDVAECVLETLQKAGAAGSGAAVLPVDSDTFPRPARRPRVSILDKHFSWSVLDITPVHWRNGVSASTLELLNA